MTFSGRNQQRIFSRISSAIGNLSRIFIFLGILTISYPLFGQPLGNVSKVATTAAAFLEIGVGSRATGMGGAFVAVADDATALYWNSAGIARLKKSDMIFIHTEWIAGINYNYLGTAIPMGNAGVLGISITSLSTEEMMVRTVDKPEGTGERFSVGDLAIGVAFARNLTDKFSIGINTKYIRQNIWNMSATGFALDLGTLFTTQFNGMKIGMSISNFGGKLQMLGKDTFINFDLAPSQDGSNDRIPANLKTDTFPLPLISRVGLAMDIVDGELNKVTLAVDAAHPNDNSEYMNLGMEYSYDGRLFLRGGYKNLFLNDSEENLTLGAGIVYNINNSVIIKFDYSYQEFGRLINTQSFSIAFEF
ncbi:MAG: PorV/PorQ family protein [Candidatus Marinimicrobia bacterium]|nr:PorV/PorQ family protein [Candidatus Neomarinimicrobiota bacterium]